MCYQWILSGVPSPWPTLQILVILLTSWLSGDSAQSNVFFCLCDRSKLFSSPNNVHAILKGWKQWTQCSATFYTTGPGCSQYVWKFRFFYVFIIRQAQKSWNKRIFANPSKIRGLWILFSLRCDKTIQDRELIFSVRFQSPSSLKHKLTLNSPLKKHTNFKLLLLQTSFFSCLQMGQKCPKTLRKFKINPSTFKLVLKSWKTFAENYFIQ